MDRDELLRVVEHDWAQLEAALAAVPLEELDGPSGVPDWSVLDLVGHVTAWEQDTLDWVSYVVRGVRRPLYSVDPAWTIDAHNAALIAAKRATPPVLLLLQAGETHQRLLNTLRALPDAALADQAVVDHVAEDTFNHYRQHALDLASR